MKSRIQNVTPSYTKFENILPDELSHTKITEELEEAKNEINKIIEEDLRNIKSLQAAKIKQLHYQFSRSDIVLLCSLDYEPISFTITC